LKPDLAHLRLFHTFPRPCPYLPGRDSRFLVVDPKQALDDPLYAALLALGFRRSGREIYRPACEGCRACVPIRIPVERFSPRRSQRRIWNRYRPITTTTDLPAQLHEEHFALYVKYLERRHPEGEMAAHTREEYLGFLAGGWSDTRFVEFRQEQELLAVAVTDTTPAGLSAVYTFFDPDRAHGSPGVFSILWQIEAARRRKLPWLYLGFWIPGCRKMEYKQDYRPLQLLSEEGWQEFPPDAPLTGPWESPRRSPDSRPDDPQMHRG
jgi:arginyl-tRNA--protein-N-Asp/Glu arginylyltransferase